MVHRLAVFEQQQGGDGGDLVALGQLRDLIDVDLAEGDLRVLLGQLFHHGGKHRAGPHQAAQKSSSTGAEDWVTFVSKFSWLMVVIAIITLPFGVSVFVGFMYSQTYGVLL